MKFYARLDNYEPSNALITRRQQSLVIRSPWLIHRERHWNNAEAAFFTGPHRLYIAFGWSRIHRLRKTRFQYGFAQEGTTCVAWV